MSRSSTNCIIILTFFLAASFLIMPYLLSDIAPSTGLTVSEMTIGLGVCNAVAALTLYLRPVFSQSSRMLTLIMVLIVTGSVAVLSGMSSSLPLMLMVGVGLMRISLVNFSDFNRQIHMQTNNEAGIKRALSTANVVSNVVSCSVPLAAAGILQKWGILGLVKTAVFLALCSAVLAPLLFTRKASLKSVAVLGKPLPENTVSRFHRYLPLYLIVLMNSIIFAFIFSYIPLRITQVRPDKIEAAQNFIAVYFTVNSLAIVIFSFPVLFLTEKLGVHDKKVVLSATLFALASVVPFMGYEGELYRILSSSVLMAISEILFLPYVISFVSAFKSEHREMVLKDVTLLSVSVSAALSAPIAGLLYHAGNKGLLLFIVSGVSIFIFCMLKLEGSLK
ncbi:hypothetical protein ACE2AK_25290 [Rahnella perminowiae]|uniref:hypothetical protein n=1 Tax=Rahnella TaxID=34037 RepID=UPI001C274DA0|nr:hypothetical protein [Rahnella aceris]MBU9849658.1 hypothetical protein [Rahnella aceris]MBU9861253.1 hypothetical protein [Rahnella aceris]